MASPVADIVVVTHYFPSHGGGIELVAARLVEQYLEAGYCVEWFASGTDEAPKLSNGLRSRPVKASNILERITQLPYPLWTPSAIPMLWRAIGHARAVHVHEHLYIGSMIAIVIGYIRRKPVVLTQHMGALDLPSRLGTFSYQVGARALAVPMMRLASHVAFISSNVLQFFGHGPGGVARRTLIFNGLDTSIFHPHTDAQRRRDREELNLAQDAAVVIFSGRFVRKKGMHLLRDLAGRMREVTWLFAGAGPEDPIAWHLPNVHPLGRLSQTELSRAYRAADVLVLPSSGEGFPLVVQESLACGTSVLSTNEVANACPEAASLIHAEAYEGGQHDVPRWEARLRHVLLEDTGPQKREERALRAAEMWSWRECAAIYLQLLGLAATSHRPPS